MPPRLAKRRRPRHNHAMTDRAFATDVVRRLKEAGFEALWAGGCVRDQLLGREPADYDVATDARPEQVQQLFKRTVAVGVSFGVVEVRISGQRLGRYRRWGEGVRQDAAGAVEGKSIPMLPFGEEEIHGEEGDLQITATSRASMQRQELSVRGARGDAKELAELPIPDKYRWVPEELAPDSRYNVAQLYARLAESIRDGKPISPGFGAAVTRHRLLDAIVGASETE